MQVKLPPGFQYGTILTSRIERKLEMCVIARGVYRLRPGAPIEPILDPIEQGFLSGDRFADEDEERTGPLLHASDFADFKLKADVLLRGSCHPGKGRVARECTVSFQVGAWVKHLRVFGRRVWTEIPGDPISQPVVFSSMPLSWENAFGGPSQPNRVGKGADTPELPTVEAPDKLIMSKRARPAPASYLPIAPSWPGRAGKEGMEYDGAWKKHRAPFVARDFDWTFFNAAPPDQQLPYLKGDEELAFRYLHPEQSNFQTRLPGIRACAYVRYANGETREIPMNLDTLLADLDEERLFLTWRGLAPVQEDDFADVRTLLLGTEEVSRRRPAAEWIAEVDAFEKDPLGVDGLVPAEVQAKLAEAKALAARASEKPAGDPLSLVKDKMAQSPTAGPAGVEANRFAQKLEGRIAEAKAKLAQVGSKGPPAPEGDPWAHVANRLAASREKVSAASSPAAAATLSRLDAAASALSATKARYDAAMARAQGSAGALGLPSPPGATEKAQAATAAATGQAATAAPPNAARAGDAPGKGANLIGRDLSGADLRGHNLEGALLRRAKLANAKLAGANLKQADLSDSDLSEADLSEADLSRAVLMGARAPRAVFARATMTQTLLGKANLAEGDFSGAKLQMAILSEAVLERASFAGAVLFKVFASKARMDQADFRGSSLEMTVFQECSLRRVLLGGARLQKAAFLQSDLTEASLVEATGEGNAFLGSKLDGALLQFARLPRSHFTEASLEGAKFYGSYFVLSRFYRARLEGAALVKSDFRSAVFNKAVVGQTKFVGSNLYDAKLLDLTSRAACDFLDANLTGAMWKLP
jgi:uncharacterized protein YjbI with pentapeptide repeats